MKVKTRNIIELVLRGVILASLCIPFFAVMQNWQYDNNSITYHGIASLEFEETVSALGASFGIGGLNVVAGILFIGALTAGIVFSIRQLLRKGRQANDKLVAILAIAEFVTFVIFAVVVLSYKYESEFWQDKIEAGFGMYLTAILVLASTLLTVIGYKQAEKNGVVEEAGPTQNGEGTSKELRELKKLLDDGVITQEEFEAKKKQLLGL